MHYKDRRIQDYSPSLSDWAISLKCPKLDAELKNKTKDFIMLTLRFTSWFTFKIIQDFSVILNYLLHLYYTDTYQVLLQNHFILPTDQPYSNTFVIIHV